ncbi:FtsX-like permease family protein [Streptomyces monomycini]|uniref:FtsX-like permease family protein n=1 Tax=Streptomyces monomycini TaxID=371720 RepID=UPI0004AAC284|nr:ABC transporter permease [Streptomyces monomycini]
MTYAPHDHPVRPRRTARFLAARSLKLHRKAWAAVFAVLVLTSLVLGGFALATLSAVTGHARVERYAGAAAVVTGDQTTRYTAEALGGETQSTSAELTERVRVPRSVLPRIAAVPGVRAAVADDAFPVAMSAKPTATRTATRTSAPTNTPTSTPNTSSTSAPVSPANPIYGHPWQAAALAPFTLREGRAPTGPRQVVLDGDLADRAGVRVGDEITVQSLGAPATYEVCGIAAPEGQGDRTGLGHQGAVFFTDQRARQLAGHPESTDAIGVLAEPGVSDEQIHAGVRAALGGADPARSVTAGQRYEEDDTALTVLTGDSRGEPEFLEAAPSRWGLLQLLASVCALVVMIAVLVVAGTVAQAVHQRAREMALLRAVGATPGQLRATVSREVRTVAVVAAVIGAIGAVPVFGLLLSLLRSRDAVPAGLELPTPWWLYAAPLLTAGLTVLVAWIAGTLACRRTARVSPAQAMGEAQGEPERPGRGRTVTGLVMLFLGVMSAGTAVLQFGEVAAMAASTAAMTLVIGCALLGPWIARGALRVLGAPARRFGGVGGYLAAAAAQANARRLGAAITPIVLMVAFVVVQMSGGATLDRQGGRQGEDAVHADLAVTTDGPGITQETVGRLGRVPGVAAASGVLHSTVVLARKELGDPRLDRLPVLAVSPAALPRVLDPGVVEGDTAELGRGTVAVGKDRARSLGLGIGSAVTLRYGDGANVSLRVAAIYERSLALGDFLFAPEELAPHMSAPLHSRVLLSLDSPGDQTQAVVRRVLADSTTGARVTPDPAGEQRQAEDRGVGEVITVVAVSVIGGFTVIAVLSTLTLIMIGRRQEIQLLRLVGAGRRQIRRMLRIEAAVVGLAGLVVGTAVALVPLIALSLPLAGTLPYLPPAQAGTIVAVVAVTVAAGTLLPMRPALRKRHPAGPGGR